MRGVGLDLILFHRKFFRGRAIQYVALWTKGVAGGFPRTKVHVQSPRHVSRVAYVTDGDPAAPLLRELMHRELKP